MEKRAITVRPNAQEQCEKIGFFYHSVDEYWRENVCYKFTRQEIEAIEKATYELHAMCLEAATKIVEDGDYHHYGFQPDICALIERSWNNDFPYLYGRFDLAYDGKDIKMLEYNADTPTCLLEASVCQWDWLKDKQLPDQFNSLHEGLIERWRTIRQKVPIDTRLFFTALKLDVMEDECHINYLMDTAIQAGFDCSSISLEEIGWDNKFWFVDVKEQPINVMFKLYPWEHLVEDAFAQYINKCGTLFIEPAWKMLLSNKTILPLLWEQFPKHPLLLESHFPDDKWSGLGWVRKPALAREGENVTIFLKDGNFTLTTNPYYDKKYIFQKYFNIPTFDGQTPVIGSWMIGEEARGIGIREDQTAITNNKSHFVPHYFE